MRIRPLAALSVAALSAVLLAGCTGQPEPEATPTNTTAAADLCSVAAPSGAVSDSITVGGEVGTEATAEFEAPLEITSAERTVAVEGDGDPIADGDLITYAATIFDASTGEVLEADGYDTTIPPVSVTVGSGADQFFGCAPIGSRIVMAVPATEQSPTAVVWVLDVLGKSPTAAWGEEQEPVDGMPTVTLADNGQPEIEIPEGDAPTEIQIAVLKEGDGEPVAAGDTTLLQYYGVDWETGESFDSSWANGAPISIPGNTYVPGFIQALEGQPVGSQVLVVIPPALGYGEAGSSEHELAGKTLVFVIDILSTEHAAQ
ncbi:peptidylprolyl isomerase [Microbacterium sp. Root166]|uniref:FKBP-type peptidyl-prolyl cis-trans isomerase n=1 Tax=Microbacterium sp. Root166 TaxID=1736478 RepID=UPI0006FB3C88|nr:FKBP-type peptidyl-prolyl cis-trans isomerase [Microbacterium sp. Root166]KQZ82206.1 peptidylprolyl isomerase [Microbacterium sp. Root166]